jgi:hypothetical protein
LSRPLPEVALVREANQFEAIIDTDVFVENAKKFGTNCGKNPTMSIVNAAESVLGK